MDKNEKKDRRMKKTPTQTGMEIAKIALIALVICQLQGCITLTPMTRDNECIRIPFIDICIPTEENNETTKTIQNPS